MKKDEYLGYLKYSGKAVEGGFLDTRKSSEALLGFDEILRYFVVNERPDLKNLDFEIPVRIEKGSWVAFIPQTIEQWIVTGTGLAFAAYVTSAATKIAQKDFKDVGLRDVFKNAIKSAQWVIRISSHIGIISKEKFDGAKIKQNNGKILIDIPDAKGKMLEVPKKYFDVYTACPKKIFSKNTGLIEDQRTLELGVFDDGKEEKIFITKKEKHIFHDESDRENVLFPELKHGQQVSLEGYITRGNERSNTIGFEYNEHVLTCRPINGDIVQFKNKIISHLADHFFPKIKIVGNVDRVKQKNNLYKEEDRPQIVFSDIIPLEKLDKKKTLFDRQSKKSKQK